MQRPHVQSRLSPGSLCVQQRACGHTNTSGQKLGRPQTETSNMLGVLFSQTRKAAVLEDCRQQHASKTHHRGHQIAWLAPAWLAPHGWPPAGSASARAQPARSAGRGRRPEALAALVLPRAAPPIRSCASAFALPAFLAPPSPRRQAPPPPCLMLASPKKPWSPWRELRMGLTSTEETGPRMMKGARPNFKE